MKSADQLTAEEQAAILADRYTLRAEAYDTFWSPVIRPVACLRRVRDRVSGSDQDQYVFRGEVVMATGLK